MSEFSRRQLLKLSGASLAEVPAAGTDAHPLSGSRLSGSTYPRSPAEIKVGVVPVSPGYPPGHVFRYCTARQIDEIQRDVWPATGCEQAIQNAIDSTSGDVFLPSGIYYIGAPLYITERAIPNIRLVGESRTTTYIQPLKPNIKDASRVNALIINQQDNGKFSMSRIRLASQRAAYSGVCISAVENGPGKQQAIFSGSFEDCWFDTGNTNSGFFVGGLNNFRVSNCVWEFQKGIFLLQGAGGGGDVIFTDCVLSNCFDYFIQHLDAHLLNIISVKGLHAYTHNRGQLFNIANAASIIVTDVILQAASGAANLGEVGIGIFSRCSHLQMTNINSVASAANGIGPTGKQLAFQECTAQVSDCLFDGCEVGIELAGSGRNHLSFSQVDIINATRACFQVAGGNPAGWVQVSDSSWADCRGSNVNFAVPASFDMHMQGCRIVNAGLSGKPESRNIAAATTGLMRMSDCVIGRSDDSAAAAYYIDAAGSGDFVLTNPVFIGAAPAAIQNPHARQQASMGETQVEFSASITFSAGLFERFVITASDGSPFTVNAPTGACRGKRISVVIRNNSAAALGNVIWAREYRMARWISPHSGHSRAIDFHYDGANWIELARTTEDVPN